MGKHHNTTNFDEIFGSSEPVDEHSNRQSDQSRFNEYRNPQASTATIERPGTERPGTERPGTAQRAYDNPQYHQDQSLQKQSTQNQKRSSEQSYSYYQNKVEIDQPQANYRQTELPQKPACEPEVIIIKEPCGGEEHRHRDHGGVGRAIGQIGRFVLGTVASTNFGWYGRNGGFNLGNGYGYGNRWGWGGGYGGYNPYDCGNRYNPYDPYNQPYNNNYDCGYGYGNRYNPYNPYNQPYNNNYDYGNRYNPYNPYNQRYNNNYGYGNRYNPYNPYNCGSNYSIPAALIAGGLSIAGAAIWNHQRNRNWQGGNWNRSYNWNRGYQNYRMPFRGGRGCR